MKKIIFLILTGLALTQGVFAQANKQQISDIEKVRLEIKNNIPKLEKIEKAKDSHGYRDIYLKNKELNLTIVDYKDQDTDKYVEWYFSKGQLIYSEELWTNILTGKITNNQKYYMVNEQMVAWIRTDKTMVDSNSKEFKDFGKALVLYAETLKGEAK